MGLGILFVVMGLLPMVICGTKLKKCQTKTSRRFEDKIRRDIAITMRIMLQNSESIILFKHRRFRKSLETTRAVELYQDMLLTAILGHMLIRLCILKPFYSLIYDKLHNLHGNLRCRRQFGCTPKSKQCFLLSLRIKQCTFLSLMKDPGSADWAASQNIYMSEI